MVNLVLIPSGTIKIFKINGKSHKPQKVKRLKKRSLEVYFVESPVSELLSDLLFIRIDLVRIYTGGVVMNLFFWSFN